MKVHSYKDYRQFMADKMAENAEVRGYQKLLAQAAGCQSSFLSQVLRSHVQLTPDQAAGLAAFWKLDEDETEYFLTLVHWSRAGTPVLRNLMQAKLKKLRLEAENLGRRYRKAPTFGGGREPTYYASWYHSAVHILVTIPRFRTVRAIAERLRLPFDVVQSCLATLEEMKLVRKTDAGWQPTQNNVHLPGKSILAALQHSTWRNRTVQKLQEGDLEGVHYTAVHALASDDVEKLKEVLHEAIERTRKIVEPSPEEELVVLQCDLYRLS